jgi:hypothetical protein
MYSEIKSKLAMAKAALKNTSFHQQVELKFKEETDEMLHLEHSFCMVLKLGHYGKEMRSTLKVLKCGAGEGWRRSV